MNLRTAYRAHDGEYRRRRAKGYGGWDLAESVAQTVGAVNEFLKDVDLPAKMRVLEFGCGAGDLLLPWAAKGHWVCGVDIAPFAIEWAKEKAAASGTLAEWYVGDVTLKLELPIEPVDLVLDGHCLHCIIGCDRERFFKNAAGNLVPSGLLMINTMCGDPKHPHGRANFDAATRTVVVNGMATRYFGMPDEILAEIKAGGFGIVKSCVIPAQYDGDEDCLLALVKKLS